MRNEFYPAYKIGNYHSSFLILHSSFNPFILE